MPSIDRLLNRIEVQKSAIERLQTAVMVLLLACISLAVMLAYLWASYNEVVSVATEMAVM